LISTAYIRGHLVKVDLTQIHPVINSFQSISPFASLPGMNGDLLRAVDRGDLNKVKDSIDKGADINAINAQQNTPLQEAIRSRKDNVARFLIENGADVNKPNVNNQTPLHRAAESNQEGIGELLIARGALIDPRDVDVDVIIRVPVKRDSRTTKEELMEIARYVTGNNTFRFEWGSHQAYAAGPSG
jgi:hypothetical protein